VAKLLFFLSETLDIKATSQKNIDVKNALNFIAIQPRMFRIHHDKANYKNNMRIEVE
jgi:hypothetical protein